MRLTRAKLHHVTPLAIAGVLLSVSLAMDGCSSLPTGRPPLAPGRAAGAAETLTVAAALAQAGYLGTPMRSAGSDRFVRATIGTTPADLLLDSGAPFDLLLDPSLQLGAQSGVHVTDVLSAYWNAVVSKGHWAIVDRVTVGASTLEALEAKMEPSPSAATHAVLGATALMSRGAILDYATDTLYLLAVHDSSAPTPVQPPASPFPTLRAALERGGQYRTFLALMQQAGLMPLLDSTTNRDVTSDSIVWLGLRIQAPQLSGVGAMPPNDMHLRLTRQALDDEFRRPGRRTIFVPTDAAFARVPAETLAALKGDPARLARVLRAHVFPNVAIDTAGIRTLIRGGASPGPDRPAFGFHVLGRRIDVDRLTSWEEGRVVARASIVQPDLRAANGIAHGIDHVLGLHARPSPLAVALARRGYVAIPLFRREDGTVYLVQATVNGTPVRLVVATGTPGALVLDRQWAARLPASRDHEYVVTFDSVRLRPVDVTTADLSASVGLRQGQGYRTEAGILGADLLAKYHARIDCAAGMLYLQVPAVRR